MRIKRRISFVRIENEIHSDTKVDFTKEIENREILSQVKVACTHALLQGLSKDYRIAFLLGEIFGLSSEDAANSLNIKSETYRKRLSRSREMMKEFLMKNCGLMQKNAPCSCNQRLKPCLEKGMIDPYLKIAERMISEGSFSELESKYRKTIDDTERLALIYKSSPDYEANEKVLNKILKLFNLEKESAH
jgi:hypothetical protein